MKHNNPFKMVGPWIGAGSGLLLGVLGMTSIYGGSLNIILNIFLSPAKLVGLTNADPISLVKWLFIFWLIAGFLIGWFIQSKVMHR
jgi:hypothetical protein